VAWLVEVARTGDGVAYLQASPDPLGVPVIEDRVDGRREIGAVPGRDDDETVAPLVLNSTVLRRRLRIFVRIAVMFD
jgi:hypothetical protein